MSCLPNQIGIETRGQCQWYWKNSAMAVNDIIPKKQRDMSRTLLHRQMLIIIGLFRPNHIKERTYLSLGDHAVIIERIALRTGHFSRRVLS